MSNPREYIWKEGEHTGRLTVLNPVQYSGQISSIQVVDRNGNVLDSGRFRYPYNDGRGIWDFSRSPTSYGPGVTVRMNLENGQSVTFPGGGNRVVTTNPIAGTAVGKGNQVGGGGQGAVDAQGNPTGASVQESEGIAFAQAGTAPMFPTVNFQPIPNIEVPVVDPIDRTGEVGAFNLGQFATALELGKKNAAELIQTEFDQLKNYNKQAQQLSAEAVAANNLTNQGQVANANVFNRGQIPAANEFNQSLIGPANEFNQAQRLSQVEAAIPGARDEVLSQLDRAHTLSEGRFPSTLEDRAFETSARNAAADQTQVRGFGDDSVVGRKASDLLSAQQRLQLSQAGSQQTDRFLTLGANLLFDQPIKFNPIQDQPLKYQPLISQTSQQISGAPARPASELATQQQGAATELSTISPSQAIGFDVGQNQFQANLSQASNMFNSQGALQAGMFNSTGTFQAGLEQFNADVFNAQSQAGATNLGNETQQAQSNFEDAQLQGLVSSGIGLGTGLALSGGTIPGADQVMSALGLGKTASPGGVTAGVATGEAAATTAGPAAVGTSVVSGGESVLGPLLSGSAPSTPSVIGGTNLGPSAPLATNPGLVVPAAIIATAAASGRGVYETIQGLADGSITGEDMRSALTQTLGPANAGTAGINAMLGQPISRRDANNAMLLGNPVTAPLALADMAGLHLPGGSGKNRRQQTRDGLRDHAEDVGVFFKPSEDQVAQGFRSGFHYMELASGKAYNVGTDGKANLRNYGINIDGKSERHTYDIDWSDPRTPQAVGYANPAALMIFGDKYQEMMGHFVNGATSDNTTLSGTKNNIRHQMERAGIDHKGGVQLLSQYHDAGKLDDQEYAAFMNGWNELMLTEAPTHEISLK